jgi:beta propeller repeat protein
VKKGLFYLGLMVLLCGIHGAAVAEDCAIEQLTEGGRFLPPQIAGQYVLWESIETAEDDESIITAWLYDLNTAETIQVTDQVGIFQDAAVGSGLVGWIDAYDDSSEVFLYQPDTGITTQLTDNRAMEAHLHIHNGLVVWTQVAEGGNMQDAGDIFLYDHATGTTTQLTDTEREDYAPQVYDGRVVWMSLTPQESFIRLYENGVVRVISDESVPHSAPQINGRWVVWIIDTEDTLRDVYIYDLDSRTVSRIGKDTDMFGLPSLSDSGIVWDAYDGDDTDIFFYDGETVHQLTSNDTDDSDPDISGDVIVWEGRTDSGYHIFQYQISTGTTTPLDFSASTGLLHAQVENGVIVWYSGSEPERDDVFLYRCR